MPRRARPTILHEIVAQIPQPLPLGCIDTAGVAEMRRQLKHCPAPEVRIAAGAMVRG
jgi:hypothetical protein